MRWTRVLQFKNLFVIGAAFVAAWIATGCRDVAKEECQIPPLGSVKAWVEGVQSLESIEISGVVEAVDVKQDELDLLTIVEKGGAVRHVRFQLPEMTLPVELSHTYQFEIHNFGGWPSTYSLLIHDDEGLLFAGVSDWEVGMNVMKSGIPGIDVEKIATDCESRPHNTCYEEIKNAMLKVTIGDDSVSLFQGESARIGSYEVTCLTCQDVVYNSSCTDAGLIGVSYVIVRVAKGE